MTSVSRADHCRISGSKNLIPVLSLGNQFLTGVFPRNIDADLTSGPLGLSWCPDSGLLQLDHSYDLNEMYGENYGYRSGLNEAMITHLRNKVFFLQRLCPLVTGDLVLDIGSNDATLLNSYDHSGIVKVGIDPSGDKFRHFYRNDTQLVPDFFTARKFRDAVPGKSAKIITSIAMFYDLEDPKAFVRDIASILEKDGIWHFEQSYMPAMLRMNAYDTVCHEHLEYYSLSVVKSLLESEGLKIIDVQMNAVNGGSFAVTASHRDSSLIPNYSVVDWLLGQEERMGLDTPKPFRDFEERVFRHRADLTRLIKSLSADGKKIVGYGASTKGNVLLQFCGFTVNEISCIAEVNPNKYGSYTPGTSIPILSENDVKSMRPDYMLVLPWHFRDSVIRREAKYLAAGGKMIFPLPEIEIL
jgi:hypothetical protein